MEKAQIIVISCSSARARQMAICVFKYGGYPDPTVRLVDAVNNSHRAGLVADG